MKIQTGLLLIGSCLLAAVAAANPVSRTVELSGIEHIHLLGQYALEIRQGDEEFVTLEAKDAADLDKVEAKVRGDALALGGGIGWQWWSDEPRARFIVQVKTLKSLTHRGSGHITLRTQETDDDLTIITRGSGAIEAENIRADELEIISRGSGDNRFQHLDAEEIEIVQRGSSDFSARSMTAEDAELKVHGSGDIHIKEGAVDEMELKIYGSGDMDLRGVTAQETEVSIRGSGHARVSGTGKLDVKIDGSGNLTYQQEPEKISVSIDGSGTAQRATQ